MADTGPVQEIKMLNMIKLIHIINLYMVRNLINMRVKHKY